MSIKNTSFGGTDWIDGAVLSHTDLNDTFNASALQGMVKISTKTPTSSDTVEFTTTEITSTYETYVIVFRAAGATGTVGCHVALGSATYETDKYDYITTDDNSVDITVNQASAQIGTVTTAIGVFGTIWFTRNGVGSAGEFIATCQVTKSTEGGLADATPQKMLNDNTGILNKIKFLNSGGNYTDADTSFTLYGIKE